MFYDWLKVYQDFDEALPLIGDRACIHIDTETGEQLKVSQPKIQHEGSYSTTLSIAISDNRLTVTGNPSRINRLDNLFGYTRLFDCLAVYNTILRDYDLPPFTPCTRTYHRQSEDGKRVQTYSDGAHITELHITTNQAVGQGNEDDYLKALATQPYRYAIPRLLTNGKTVDWLPKSGSKPLRIYPSVYNKAHEMGLHLLPRLKKREGRGSATYQYADQVKDYCQRQGVIRYELKLKSQFLREQRCRYYGLFNERELNPYINHFLNIDQRLQVSAMNIETINQTLLREQIVSSTHAANTTASYAIRWLHGERFDFNKKQPQVHRARLRKIGIDIAQVCDVSAFSPVRVTAVREITRKPLAIPTWYRRPEQMHLRLAA